jgi:PIN domain nuclease of toxin-antitoxin system
MISPVGQSPLLLDSNIVVWLDQKSARIPPALHHQLQTNPVVYLSAVTAWELGIKQSLGKLKLASQVSEIIRDYSMRELPVTVTHGEAVRTMPPHHRDPFDRLLVAQAMVEGLVLVTSDRKLLRYGVPILLV